MVYDSKTKRFSPVPEAPSYTAKEIEIMATCPKCKDVFSLLGRQEGETIWIAPQSHIRDDGGKMIRQIWYSVDKPLYHHCGVKLRLLFTG